MLRRLAQVADFSCRRLQITARTDIWTTNRAMLKVLPLPSGMGRKRNRINALVVPGSAFLVLNRPEKPPGRVPGRDLRGTP
jgi:hypothetical protein